jgi:hypothetical protein
MVGVHTEIRNEIVSCRSRKFYRFNQLAWSQKVRCHIHRCPTLIPRRNHSYPSSYLYTINFNIIFIPTPNFFQVIFSFQISWLKFLLHYSSLYTHPTHLIVLTWSPWQYMAKRTNYEAAEYAISLFYSLMSKYIFLHPVHINNLYLL